MSGEDNILLTSLQRAFHVPAARVNATIVGTCDIFASYLGRFLDGLTMRLSEQAEGVDPAAARARMGEVLPVLFDTQSAFADLADRAARASAADRPGVRKAFVDLMASQAPTLQTLFATVASVGEEQGGQMGKIQAASVLLAEVCESLQIPTEPVAGTGAAAQLSGQLRPLLRVL